MLVCFSSVGEGILGFVQIYLRELIFLSSKAAVENIFHSGDGLPVPVLSWSFMLDVGLTGWTGWLKISVDFSP